MRSFAIIAAALLATALLVAPAAAQATADTAAPRKGLWDISKDQRPEAQEMFNDFKDELQTFNVQIRDKLDSMNALFDSRTLNESKIRALANEIMALRSTVYKMTVEFRIEFYKEFGVLPF